MGGRDCSTLTLSMADRDFAEIQLDLEETLSQLKRATDPKLRQQLLTQIRTLLAEADRILLESANSPENSRQPTTWQSYDLPKCLHSRLAPRARMAGTQAGCGVSGPRTQQTFAGIA